MGVSDHTISDLVSQASEHHIIPSGELAQTIDNLPVGLYWNHPGIRGTFIYVNQTLVDMFGYASREEFMNIDAVDLYPDPGDREEFSQRLLDDGKLRGIELRLKKKDGTLIWCRESSHAVLNEAGEVICFHGVIEDITELIRQRKSIEAASTAKSSFLANMSHEIRTPLNGIMGMIDLAMTTKLTGEQQEYMGTVKSCADSLLSLINDILDLSKIEAGKLELERITFGLRELADGVLDVMAYPAAGKALELIGHVDSDVPSQVKGDPTRLRQVLINLVGNAIKFTEKGEVLLKIDTAPAGPEGMTNIRFTVSDTGMGIPEEKVESIFDSFTQADESFTRTFGGTGLGLTISRELVEVMGGKLGLKTTAGEGATFFFTLPMVPVQTVQAHENGNARPKLKGARVLVVDDNSNNRLILRQELSELGCAVEEGGCGGDAIEMIARSAGSATYDLVILDLKLPGLDGFATARQIRTSNLKKQPKLLLMTALGVRGDANRCREIGIDGYFVKPIKHSLLLEAINRVMTPQDGAREISAGDPELLTRYDLEERKASNSGEHTILLAEDHPVNTKLAVRLLEDVGYTVVAAANGREALELLETEKVDLVLMDIQMPVMDGLEATRAIRQQEKYADLPIIAMTAHAMTGDREMCLDSGMSDYITKPINQELMYGIISSWLGHGSSRNGDYHAATTSGALDRKNQPAAKTGEPGKSPIDMKKALALVSGDRGFLEELLRDYLEDIPQRLENLEQAIADSDADTVRRTAHSIKGASTSLGTETLGELAKLLENNAASGNLVEAQELHQQIVASFTRLETHLKNEFPEIGKP